MHIRKNKQKVTKEDKRCCCCASIIKVGEYAIYTVSKIDGEFFYGRFCNKCEPLEKLDETRRP